MSKRLGLVIGNSIYRDSTLARLATPDADVGDLADVLLDPEVGGFDDVKVLVNTSTAVARRAISDFFSVKNRDDLLLLYFSCHGVLDENGRLYLAFKDTERQLLRATSLPAAFITDEMNSSRSQRQVLVLDCCHSGAFARGSKGASGVSVGTATAFEGTGYGRVVLTATDATQYAWEDDRTIGEAVNSVFTRFLVQGLQSGEADSNNDGRITIDELYDYIYAQVVKHTPKQTPGKWSYKEQGEVVIAHNPKRSIIPETSRPAVELDDELEQRMAKMYTRGLSAYWLEEWDKAESAFQAITEAQPEYEDAAAKLAEVQRQKKLAGLYQRALAAGDAHKWDEVIASLEALEREAAGFKDTGARLAEAKKQKHLADLYDQARQLSKARQWQAVLKVFANITSIEKDFRDPDNLLSQAQRELEALNRQKELEGRYSRAFLEMEAGNWQEARHYLLQVHETEPGYGDTERLLVRIDAELARLQPAAAPDQAPAEGEEVEHSGAWGSPAAGAAQLASPAKGIERPVNWIRDLTAAKTFLNPKKADVPVSAAGALLPERSLWFILSIAAGWFFTGFIHFWQVPDAWVESVKSLSGYSLEWDGALWLIRMLISGGLAGLIFWFLLRRLPVLLSRKQGLLLIAGWSLASALGITILFEAGNFEPTGYLLSFALGGVISGLAAGWVIRQARPSLKMKHFLWIVLASALGSGMGGVIAFSSTSERLVYHSSLGSGISGLVLASVVIYVLSAEAQWIIPWRGILAAAAGFFLGDLVANFVIADPDLSGSSIYLFLMIVGAIGGAFFGLPSRSSRRILFFAALGLVGLALGHWIWAGLYNGLEDLVLLCWGAGLGLALGSSTRSLPKALILTLIGLAAVTIPLAIIFSLSDYDPTPLGFAIAWGAAGGILAFGWSFLGSASSTPHKTLDEGEKIPVN